MNPPLREQRDVDALRAGLADGTIDAIATDHAPHARGDEGRAVRGGAARACSASRPRSRSCTRPSSRPGVRRRSRRRSAALSWQPARIAGLDAAGHGGPIAARCRRAPVRVRSRRSVGRRRAPAREPVGELPVGRLEADRQGAPHDPRRRADRARREPGVTPSQRRSRTARCWPTATTFEGVAVGYRPEDGVAAGEVVFNTALSGYQEIVTDPSYAGQIITFTYPHIGNYGVNVDDDQAAAPHCRGVIVRDLARRSSNWRATDDLEGFLKRHHVAAIAGIDTRRLTRHIRSAGAMPGAFGVADPRRAPRRRAGRRRHRRPRPGDASSPRPRPYTVGRPTRRTSSSRTTSASSGRSSTSSSRPAARSRSCPRRHPAARRARARTRRRVPLQRSR